MLYRSRPSAVRAVVLASLAALMAQPANPASAQTPPEVRPIAECIDPQPDGTYNVIFGWEVQAPGSVTIPVGSTNQLSGGTVVAGPDTFFERPIGASETTRAHVVWPPFVWDPPGRDRSGRTLWWADERAVVNVSPTGSASYRLDSRTASLGVGAATQRCSQHVFLAKTWDGSLTPPAELDKQAYALTISHASNPLEPTVLNDAVSVCRYLEYATPSTFFAPYGSGFTTTESDGLNCAYENDLPYSSDIGGYWVPRRTVYEITETGVPSGWENASGLGQYSVDFAEATSFASCGWYPSFGTFAAVADSDGSMIPEFGRASAKWCLHTVANVRIATTTTTTTTTLASTTTTTTTLASTTSTTNPDVETTTTSTLSTGPDTTSEVDDAPRETQPEPGDETTELPATGRSDASLALAAAGLVALGIASIAATRRRRLPR